MSGQGSNVPDVQPQEHGKFPVVEHGNYSGSDTTYQNVCSWEVKSEYGTLEEIIINGDTSDEVYWKLIIGNNTVFNNLYTQSKVDRRIKFGSCKIQHDTTVVLQVLSSLGNAIVADGVIIGSENFNYQGLKSFIP